MLLARRPRVSCSCAGISVGSNTVRACRLGPEGQDSCATLAPRLLLENGILKAEAVLHAARILVTAGIQRPAEVLDATHEQLDRLRAAWVLVHGQGSGISLDYFLMLTGMEGVKGDRMIRRLQTPSTGWMSLGAITWHAHDTR